MDKITTVFIGFLLFSLSLLGQGVPFSLLLEPINISGLSGLQSYAVGQDNGKWLIVGGRLDGLHQRQPFAAFNQAGHNNQLLVVDPVSQQRWSTPLSALPSSIREQLSSTNMQFFQEGNELYCIGGYGYSPTVGDHTTYPNLTAINVPEVINAVLSNSNIAPWFRQISDPQFQVTGGRLKKINDTYYLMGGQKFLGRYNPVGPDHGPGFIQEYTNAIRKFTLQDDGTTLIINHLPSFVDSINLHRRDYNAEAQILPTGAQGITMFSGVFQPVVDLPYLNSVTIDSANYTVNNSFQQHYNHYHCAVLPLYSAANNEMHNVFFGGIAQFYDSLGMLVQDNNVPFVNTIARVTRDASGTMAEYKLPIEMPVLLGAGSEFIPNKNIPHYPNEVFKLDQITADSTLVGYIYGGISSSAKNIFFINTGNQSNASSQVFKVIFVNTNPVSIHDLNEQSRGTLNLKVSPNPSNGNLEVSYFLSHPTRVELTITDINGRTIDHIVLEGQMAGENTYRSKEGGVGIEGIFFLTLETPFEKSTRKIRVER